MKMSEEEKKVETKADADAVVSKEELENIEKSLLEKDKEKEAAIRASVEAEIKEKMAVEQRLKDLEAEKAKLEAAVKKQAEEKAIADAAKTQELEELKKQIGSTKHVINTQSPFNSGSENPNAGNFAANLTSDDIKDIDEESKQAFFRKHGLGNNWEK